MKKSLCLLALVVLIGCKSVPLRTDLIKPGQTKDQVIAILGAPGYKQSQGKREAWQYCRSGLLATDDYLVVWFLDGLVAGHNSYRSGSQDPRNGTCDFHKDVFAPLRDFVFEESVYTRFNIHADDDTRDGRHYYNASYTGWVSPPGVGHVIVPPNTQVFFQSWHDGFAIREKATGRVIRFEFDSENMQMREKQYFNQITSLDPVSLEGLSEVDRKGIAEGVVSVGMSKQGVLIAYGMPAKHKTPSLNDSSWFYWRNRFDIYGIGFDKDGIVREIKD